MCLIVKKIHCIFSEAYMRKKPQIKVYIYPLIYVKQSLKFLSYMPCIVTLETFLRSLYTGRREATQCLKRYNFKF